MFALLLLQWSGFSCSMSWIELGQFPPEEQFLSFVWEPSSYAAGWWMQILRGLWKGVLSSLCSPWEEQSMIPHAFGCSASACCLAVTCLWASLCAYHFPASFCIFPFLILSWVWYSRQIFCFWVWWISYWVVTGSVLKWTDTELLLE